METQPLLPLPDYVTRKLTGDNRNFFQKLSANKLSLRYQYLNHEQVSDGDLEPGDLRLIVTNNLGNPVNGYTKGGHPTSLCFMEEDVSQPSETLPSLITRAYKYIHTLRNVDVDGKLVNTERLIPNSPQPPEL